MNVFAEDLVFINRVAQGYRSFADAVEWFNGLPAQDRKEWNALVGNLAIQAGAAPHDAAKAATLGGIERGSPCCVVMSKGKPSAQLGRVLNFHDHERERTFRFLLALLSVADERRRHTKCIGGCSHWWHRDLGSDQVVEELVSSGIAGARRTSGDRSS